MRGERVWRLLLMAGLVVLGGPSLSVREAFAGEAGRSGAAEDGLHRLDLVPEQIRRVFPDAGLVRGHPLEGEVRGILARLWRVAGARRGRTVGVAVIAETRGFQAISIPAVDGIWISAEYLIRLQEVSEATRARRLARAIGHELGHLLAGHEGHAEQNELEAERIGIGIFERAGFDCAFWVESLAGIAEPAETPGRVAGQAWSQAWAGLTKARLVANAEEACRAAKAAGPPAAQ